MQNPEINQQFDLAVQFVNYTGKHIFLTGKAGTGKTTFLRHIKETCRKKMAVIAPTGVAAINAGGVTIHSMFQLPFGSFLPSRQFVQIPSGIQINNQTSLLKHMHYSSDKRQLLQELELLVIDEISMVRADLLDAIDFILRQVRRRPHQPFGGVQMVYIGDLFQLPPVVSDDEWSILKEFYKGMFFFNAVALRDSPPVYLELKKIYRQNEPAFINLLNKVRTNRTRPEDHELLNSYYKPDFKPEKSGEYITLTTHNSRAEIINNNELRKLNSTAFTFNAEIKGEFSERSYPADTQLQLKAGAQIMFIRNDKGEHRRYYNGKIATVTNISQEKITVKFPGSGEEFVLENETWRNIRYQYNKDTDQIEEEEAGTFTQYPVRLAWAITIHKSQGLTFEKAIVDAGESFAPGQVYVALSRLTSLDGLVLKSKIYPHSISTDEQALYFSSSETEAEILEEELSSARESYLYNSLFEIFDWNKIADKFHQFQEEMAETAVPLREEAESLFQTLVSKTAEQKQTVEKFSRQLDTILRLKEADYPAQLLGRVEAAHRYFTERLEEDILVPLKAYLEKVKIKPRTKKYTRELGDCIKLIEQKKAQLEQALKISGGLKEGQNTRTLIETVQSRPVVKSEYDKEGSSGNKPVKGESFRITLTLFREGKSVEEIAEARSLARGTIEGHLCSFVATGEIAVEQLVTEDKIPVIKDVITRLGDVPSSAIKEFLGEDYTYTEIKAVLNDIRRIQASIPAFR